MRRLLAALLLLPLVDALLLVVVADVLGWPATVLLVVLTALLGMVAVRAEGRHTLVRIQRRLAAGEPPTDELVDGALLVAAGAFLLTPGVVTDAIGFLLAFPLTRAPVRRVVKRLARDRVDVQTGGFATGRVYTGGFPDQDTDDEGVYDVDPESYDVTPEGYEVDLDDEDDAGA